MTIKDKKKLLRKQIADRLAVLSDDTRQRWSITACQRAIELFTKLRAADRLKEDDDGSAMCLLTFMPIQAEIDVTPIMEWAWSSHWRVVLPRMDVAKKVLHLYEAPSYDDLESGLWGIKEPKLTANPIDLNDVDIILLPGLAFDVRGGRVGYGGGYYDKLLGLLSRYRSDREQQETQRFSDFSDYRLPVPLLVAAAFQLQLVDEVPLEEHDYKWDVLVTDQALYWSKR